ncbi:MAG: sensor histidine kinase [Chloroflexota bacterium]
MKDQRFLVGAVLVLAVVGALLYVQIVMGAPAADVEQLGIFLSASGAASLLLGTLIIRWAQGWIGGLQLRLMLAYVVGLLVALVNILATSLLMFLNGHDLALLICLLVFAAVISLAFGHSVASALTAELGGLARAAGRLAAGDLDVRVGSRGRDEIARLGTAFDHMASQLQLAFTRERELELSRRNLIATVSHDLRTPLATTRAMVEALTDGVVTEPAEVERYLRLIRGETQHLSRLIDDLFELSQIESGALELHCAPTQLPLLVEQTLEAYQAQASEQGVALEVNETFPIPSINADAARLQRVLRNLVDNALHYTPSGGLVRVETRLDGDAARVSVSDSGPGLSAGELERVFEQFYRGERARSRATPAAGRVAGAGLGLAIARALVQAHGGRIWAERSAFGGAAFHFTIPAKM